MELALAEFRKQEYYLRQTEHAKTKLELHFCLAVLSGAHIKVRDEITGEMPYADYPYRKNGGRWFAMGQHYIAGKGPEDDVDLQKYGFSGEAGHTIKNFRDLKLLELRKYDTSLGECPYYHPEYTKWFYELFSRISEKESSVNDQILTSAEELLESGILIRDADGLNLDIPVLTHEEYHRERRLATEYEKKIYQDIREVLIEVFKEGCVKLPSHLKSVPRWMQYMMCGNSVPMAVIHKAREKGLLFQGVDYPIPASVLVIENP